MPDALQRGRTASSSPRCIRRATEASTPRRPVGPRGSGAHDQPPQAVTRSTLARADGVQSFSTGSRRPATGGPRAAPRGPPPPPGERPRPGGPPTGGAIPKSEPKGPGSNPSATARIQQIRARPRPIPVRSRMHRPTTPGTPAAVPCMPASGARVRLGDRSRLPSLRGAGGPAQVRHRRGGGSGSRGRPLAGRPPEAYQEPPGAAKARAQACRRQPWRPLENPGTAKLPDRRGTNPTQAAAMAGGPRPGVQESS